MALIQTWANLKLRRNAMSHTPHELSEEFPEHIETIQRLKTEDTHFAKLFDDYHALNRDIHRAETNIEPTDDFNMADMRKKRLGLKDELWGLLSAA
jgi:uncharacterized protein